MIDLSITADASLGYLTQIYGVVFGIGLAGGGGGTLLVAVAAGEGFIAGDTAGAAAAGEALAAGAVIFVDMPATNFQSPPWRAKVSMKRYLPLMSAVFPSGILYLPFLISV